MNAEAARCAPRRRVVIVLAHVGAIAVAADGTPAARSSRCRALGVDVLIGDQPI